MLKPKQQRFVDEYLIDLNAMQAAIRAGYSVVSAGITGHRMLKKANIQEEIKRQQDLKSEKTSVSQERVLLEIARLAFNDPRNVFDSEGLIKPIHEWSTEAAAAISAIELNNEGKISKIKFWDKGKQLELASKHLGLLTENINQNIKTDHQIVILELPDNGRDQED